MFHLCLRIVILPIQIFLSLWILLFLCTGYCIVWGFTCQPAISFSEVVVICWCGICHTSCNSFTYVHNPFACRMTKEAADVLQQFYLQLRKQSSADGSPITARQLESLVRLVEARARLELREEITKQDALVNLLPPLEIMSKCFTSSFPVSPKQT